MLKTILWSSLCTHNFILSSSKKLKKRKKWDSYYSYLYFTNEPTRFQHIKLIHNYYNKLVVGPVLASTNVTLELTLETL